MTCGEDVQYHRSQCRDLWNAYQANAPITVSGDMNCSKIVQLGWILTLLPVPGTGYSGIMAVDSSIFERFTLFSGLEQAALDRLARYSREISLEKGEQLFDLRDTSDGCYTVLEGVLKISVPLSDGKETLLNIMGAGDVIGEIGLIDSQPRSAAATALKPSVLAFLPSRDFRHVADANPEIYLHMLQILSARVRTSTEAAMMQTTLPLHGRLAHVLLRLAEGFGEDLEGGRLLIRHKCTQEDLARMTGSARENINRQIKGWVEEGHLSRISGYYCIENKEKLRAHIEL